MPAARRFTEIKSGPDRFRYDMAARYSPYPFQAHFHSSTAPYGFLGGAAGPGKTLAGLMEQFTACNEFNVSDGPHVHTLSLRRTTPMLDATLITRFRETFPPELYRQYNETKSIVTWHNGATTKFGSMQYENDAWGYQGQWFHIFYDELCDFTYPQWMRTSAWNRCPVSPWARKYGAGNPIGIGALWVEDLFVKHVPCQGMDDSQKAAYNPNDYAYFPATYLDNPVYANDPQFLLNLAQYPLAFQEALKYGKWGAAGGYFRGVWDEAIHVFSRGDLDIKPWWKCLIAGTMVATERGDIPIEQVKAGDKVWTRQGLRRVLRAWRSGTNRDVSKATFSDGRTLTATPNHEIYSNGEFIALDEMSIGDRIEVWNPDITKAESTSSRPMVITKPRPSISIASFGLRQMDRSRRGTISTTKTETGQTTIFQILSVCLRLRTAKSQPKENTPWSIAQRCLRALRSGAKPQTVKSIYDCLASNLNGPLRSMRSCAEDAVKSLGPDLLKTSALLPATSVGDGAKVWTILSSRAQYAGSHSAQIRPMASTLAVGSVGKNGVWLENLKPCGKANVYDLAVEGAHEFYANGVLVHNCWISGNWGYEHPASYYKHVMDDDGILYTYDELYEQHKEPEELAATICDWAREGGIMPKFENFAHSFDAEASKATATMGENPNSVNNRMIPILRKHGIPAPHASTRDKLGRDTLMRERLGLRVRLGETAGGQVMEAPLWQVSDRCVELRRLMPIVQANPEQPEKIESTKNGEDSPLQGAGYGLYAIYGKPTPKPRAVQLAEVLAQIRRAEPDLEQTAKAMAGRKFDINWDKQHQPVRRQLRWARPSLPQ